MKDLSQIFGPRRVNRRELLGFAAMAGVMMALPRLARADAPFKAWLGDFRREALSAGIRPATFDRAFEGVEPLPHVIELDHSQPEVKRSFEDYIGRILTEDRIAKGRDLLSENQDLLNAVSGRYGVDTSIIVALWGLETSYGALPGNYSIVASLATLAYDGRRGAFFRKELIAALRILDEDGFSAADLRGSWAGAMGQTQFMPSSYLRYAVDYSGTGRADIWHDKGDVFASIANYLASSGWTLGQGWGLRVQPPIGLDPALASNLSRYAGGGGERTLDQWSEIGVKSADGRDLPEGATSAALVQPGGPGGQCLLVYPNYRVILKWNRSLYFATAACWLAEDIAS